jgi:hypothetical protein
MTKLPIYTAQPHLAYPRDERVSRDDSIFKYWHKTKLNRKYYNSKFDQDAKLADVVEQWFLTTPKSAYYIFIEQDFGRSMINDDHSASLYFSCHVLFRSKRDAALFKIFWE